jgi:hypothetical protein
MKKTALFLSSIFLFSCNCKKQTVKISPQKVALENSCPKDGDCSIEVLENKTLNVLKDEFGSNYYKLEEDFNHKVIKYTYNRKVKGDLQDAGYREEIVFEIGNDLKPETIKDAELQKTKMIFGRFCFCRGQTGNYKISQGTLDIQKDKILLNFKIDEVPQIINKIEIKL